MAVPKSKRYKQIVRSRRSLQKTNLILKKNITITKFNNYTNNLDKFAKSTFYCQSCKNKDINNNLCQNCYVDYILNVVLLKKKLKILYHKKTYRIREYYDELSKTLLSLSRSKSLTFCYSYVSFHHDEWISYVFSFN